MSRTRLTTPTIEDFERLAAEALAGIPEELRRHVQDVVIRIEEFPDRGTLHDMRLHSPYDLLGLYRGVSLNQKSIFDSGRLPDLIYLYRQPLLAYWRSTGEDLRRLIQHVMIHEIGHHFGFSDEDMEAIEALD